MKLGSEFGLAICKILNVDPKRVNEININSKPGELVAVTITHLVFDAEQDQIIDTLKFYLENEHVKPEVREGRSEAGQQDPRLPRG